MKFQLGAMSVGDILDRGLKLTMSRLGTFYLIHFIALLPFLLIMVVVPFLRPEQAMAGAVATLVAALLYMVLSQVASAAVLHVIAQEYMDRRVTVAEALQFALGKFGPLFGTSLLAGIIMFSVLFLGIFLTAFGAAAGSGVAALLGAPVILVGIVMVVVFALRYMLMSQVVVVENLAGMPALNRSSQLGAGFRGRIFGILFLVGLLSFIVGAVVGVGLGAAFPPGGQPVRTPAGFQVVGGNPINQAIHQVVTQLVNVFFGTYAAVCLTLTYFDLRVRKEGFDLELAAQKLAEPAEPV